MLSATPEGRARRGPPRPAAQAPEPLPAAPTPAGDRHRRGPRRPPSPPRRPPRPRRRPSEPKAAAARSSSRPPARSKAKPRSKDEGSSKDGRQRTTPRRTTPRSATRTAPRPTPASRRPPRPTPASRSRCPGPAPDRRPELLHRQVPDPAVPPPDLPGRRHRVRRALGGPGGDQRDRDGLRPQPQRLDRRRASAGCSSCPSSWKMYGVDANRDGRKDPYNPVDAIFAAARYLKAAGAERQPARRDLRLQPRRLVRRERPHARAADRRPARRPRRLAHRPDPGPLPRRRQGALRRRPHRPPGAASASSAATTPPCRSRASSRAAGIRIFAKAGSPVVAVQDGKIVRMGATERLGRFVQLRDVYGNTYTYAHLKKFARAYPVPKRAQGHAQAASRRELDLPERDPKPDRARRAPASRRRPRSASPPGRAPRRRSGAPARRAGQGAPLRQPRPPDRLPQRRRGAAPRGRDRPRRRHHASAPTSPSSTASTRKDVVLKRLKVGSKVIAGTILGRIGRTSATTAPHTLFEIRPAGRNAPRIDPKPILDGWKLLESTAIYRAAGQQPLLRPRRQEPVDRPDPAHEQGGAAAPRADQPEHRALRVRPPRHPRRRDRPPRPGHARVPGRQRPEADGHLAALRPRLLHRLGQRLRALVGQRRRHRRDQRHPDHSATRARARSPTSRSAGCSPSRAR